MHNEPPFTGSKPLCAPPLDRHRHRLQPNPTVPNISLPRKTHVPSVEKTTVHQSVDSAVSSWTSLIGRHCIRGRLNDAVAEFTRMRLTGVEPNHITFITLLSGCADFPSHALSLGASLHAYVRKLGLDTGNVKVGAAVVGMYCKSKRVDLASLCFTEMGVKNKVTWNTMLSGYMRNGEIEKALHLFDEMPERDVVSYTALIDGFVKKGHFEHALWLFYEMQLSAIPPDSVTIVAVISACANLGALGLGMWVHQFASTSNTKNFRVDNSLIDMYSRCGCVEFARQIFETMPERNVVSWNSIIAGFALNGNPTEALKYFHRMQKEGFDPDEVSFTGALTACSHAGLVDQGLKIYETMKKVHRISPRIEHYGCIVDLYSRARMLEDALLVIENMPMQPNEVILGSILAACRDTGDVALAEKLMRFISKQSDGVDSNYVMLSNMYAAGGKWHEASSVRKKMKNRGIEKKPGFSSIEVDGIVERFMAGDKFHVDSERIYETLHNLTHEIRVAGYLPKTSMHEQYECD